MAENSEPIWLRLSRDPRDPQYANLRASDADRTEISQAVGDAFADGRLDRAEYDERADAVLRAKTLGDFLPLLEDLMPPEAIAGTSLAPAASTDLQTQAEKAYGRELRGSVTGFVTTSAITGGIWVATAIGAGAPYFFWPIFPMLGTGIGVVSTLINKQDRIQAKYDKMLEKRDQQLSGGDGNAISPGAPEPGPNRLTGRYPANRDWRQERRDYRQTRRNWH